MNAVHPIFDSLLANLSGARQPRKYMVQVWDNGGWSDYWPVEATDDAGARRQANAALAPFWRAKRWRVIPKNTERAVADSAPNAGKQPEDESAVSSGNATMPDFGYVCPTCEAAGTDCPHTPPSVHERINGHYPTCGVGEGTHQGPCDCNLSIGR